MRRLLPFIAVTISSLTLSAYAQNPPPTPAPAPVPAPSAMPGTFSLNTTAFSNRGTLPDVYTCNGKNISPQLSWTGIPTKTVSLALILSDPDAPSGTFYHWVLYNIPKNVTNLPEGIKTLPPGAVVGQNTFGKQEYSGPCPPKGSTHSYIFTLYALDTMLDLPAGSDAKAVMDAMQSHILNQIDLSIAYGQ